MYITVEYYFRSTRDGLTSIVVSTPRGNWEDRNVGAFWDEAWALLTFADGKVKHVKLASLYSTRGTTYVAWED